MMRAAAVPLVLLVLAVPSAARADRTQVFSIQGADCGDCGDEIKAELKGVKGIKKAQFDKHTVELTVRFADGVSDDVVVEAARRAGLSAIPGPGQGAYLPMKEFPPGSDVVTLTKDGSAVGPLAKLAVPGKYTVFDIYAEWCGPCRVVDERLQQVVAARKDVAVRKLDVRDFDSPLALELGPQFETLPYVVVFSPSGKRTDVSGTDFEKLDKALQTP